MKNKRTAGFLIIFVIILAMYNVVFFLLPFEKNASAVTEYVFTLVSIILGAAITLISLNKNKTIKSKLYGFPIFKIGICYTAVQTAFGLAVCVIGFLLEVPIYISVIVSVLILGFALIGVIAADAAKDIIERQEKTDAVAIHNISALISDMKGISEQSTDPALKAQLQKLYEQFRYSDPVSSKATADLENKLAEEIAALKALVSSDTPAAAQKAEEISLLLSERNRQCKLSK